MKRLSFFAFGLTLLLALAGLLASHPAAAQDVLRQRASDALASAELALERADATTSTCDAARSDQGRQLLERAHVFYDTAMQFFSLGRYGKALDLAGHSGEMSRRVLLNCSQGQAALGVPLVQQELDRSDQILSQSTDVVQQAGDSRAQILLDESRQKQDQARAFFRDATSVDPPRSRQLTRALELTHDSRRRAQHALDLVRGAQNFNPDRVREELRRTDEMIATAVEFNEAQASGQGDERINSARALEERARHFFDQREFDSALTSTMRTRDLLRDVLSGSGSVTGADLDRAFKQAEDELGHARDSKLSTQGTALLHLAETRYDRAVEARSSGALRIALFSARAAYRLALRAEGSTQ